jgi:hypothetical protein
MLAPSITSTFSAQADGQSCGQVDGLSSIFVRWFMLPWLSWLLRPENGIVFAGLAAPRPKSSATQLPGGFAVTLQATEPTEHMHPATRFQFERTVREYSRWRAVPEDERSPAAAWWWSTALAARTEQDSMPALLSHNLELPPESTYAAGAELLIRAIAEQTALPWPDDFPRQRKHGEAEDERAATNR